MPDEARVDEQEKKIRELKKELDLVPERPGVYLFRNRAGVVIYVGKAISLRNRLRSYFQSKGQLEKTQRLVREATRFEYLVTDSEVEALVLECNLIKEYRPKYNIDLKDDKSYPYLRVTAEESPRVMVTRNLVRDGSRYFGPYPNVGAVKETVGFLRKLFPFRSCPGQVLAPRTRPCLNAQIKQCLGPCAGRVSPGDYREMIENLVLFLEGKTREVEKSLIIQMKDASRATNFEQAARLRNQLASLKTFREQQRVTQASGSDEDVLAAGMFLDENLRADPQGPGWQAGSRGELLPGGSRGDAHRRDPGFLHQTVLPRRPGDSLNPAGQQPIAGVRSVSRVAQPPAGKEGGHPDTQPGTRAQAAEHGAG